uniref:Uncharacterized protein n=1 Tax=Romanomermis culicivorax TaxID=13658 RepID=A0A915HQI1_ROMCU
MSAAPMMPMQMYNQQQQPPPQQHMLAQQQGSTGAMQYNAASQYQTGTSIVGSGWSTVGGGSMMQGAGGPTQVPMTQYQQGNRPHQSTTRGAISARLRGRNQSGVMPSGGSGGIVNSGMNPDMIGYNMMSQMPQSGQTQPTPQQQQQQLNRQQAFLQQQMEQQKMYQNENQQQLSDNNVQQQLQAQLEQQRQKLINENNVALMDPTRAQMHRHTPGTMEHPDLMRQPTTAYTSNASYGVNTPSQRMAPTPMQMAPSVSNRASPAYVGQQIGGQSVAANQMMMSAGGTNYLTQNQNFINQQLPQTQYNSPGDQQRIMQQQQQLQQNEVMMVGGNRYMPNQSQNVYGNVINQAVGRSSNQNFFAQQQQQQSPGAVGQQYNTINQNQHFQQQQQQQQQQQNVGMYQVQRMSYNNVPMNEPNSGNYSNYQQFAQDVF